MPLEADERSQVFTNIWETVRDNYVYEDYRGLDWEAIRAEFAPRVAEASSPEAFYGLMRELIGRLGDDHSRFASPQDVAAEGARYNGKLRYGGIGAVVRGVPEGGIITGLARGGPAELAGLQPRDLILRIGTIPFTDTAAFGGGGPISAIQGPPGSTITITVQSPGGQPREIGLQRQNIPADAFTHVEASRLPGTSVGLLRIDTFYLQDLDVVVRGEIERLLAEGPLDGLLVDVRGNSGGRVDLMLSTVALFVDGGTIGSSSGRFFNGPLAVPTGQVLPGLAELPVAILVDAETVSAAEMFAAGMQSLGRARLIGQPTAGNTESMRPHDLADGSRLWLAELTYRLPDGSLIEGSGVKPDVPVAAEWWRFARSDDPQVQAALADVEARLNKSSVASIR